MITRFQYQYSLSDFIYSLNKIKTTRSSFPNLEGYFGVERIYFSSQGRVSLRLLLNSLNLRKNAVIGVQAYNCNNVFDSIKIAGYEFMFIDVNESYTVDINDLANKIDSIDALIVNHTFGIPADIDKIKVITKNKPVIEDCAHSLFSTYNDKQTGTFFDASLFSIGYAKYPSIGKGGFAILNNKEFKANLEREQHALRGRSSSEEIKNVCKNYFMAFANKSPFYDYFFYPVGKMIDKQVNITNKFGHKEAKGFNSNNNLLERNFQKYRSRHEKQRANGKKLAGLVKNILPCIDDTPGKKLNFYLFPLMNKNRDNIVDLLRKKGVESGRHFSTSIEYARQFGYREGMCPQSEKVAKEIFTIPSNYSLNDRKIELIIKSLKTVL